MIIDNIQTLIRTMRLPFLALALVCVFLGITTAVQAGYRSGPVELGLVLLGALCAHISVNAFNEYADFRSGLDAITQRTPFSGGSGGLIDNPQAGPAVLRLAVVSLLVTMLVGLYFVWLRGPWLLLPGMAGILVILFYTDHLTRYPLLCLVAPGLGFGPVMVAGTHLALTGSCSLPVLLIALVPFFLTNNLLLLNQLPDLAADTSVGRRHFAISYGARRAVSVYGLFALATVATLITGILRGVVPPSSYWCLVPLGSALAAWVIARRHAADTARMLPALALNVVAALVTPGLLGLLLLYQA